MRSCWRIWWKKQSFQWQLQQFTKWMTMSSGFMHSPILITLFFPEQSTLLSCVHLTWDGNSKVALTSTFHNQHMCCWLEAKLGNPLHFAVKSKQCNYCINWKKKNADLVSDSEDERLLIPEHKCMMNHDGSSVSMEPLACLHMITTLFYKFHCIVNEICADDDTSIRSLVKWSNADYMRVNNTEEPPMAPITRGPNKGKLQVHPDQGKLQSNVPEPTFVADPNHQKKLLTGELLPLVSANVEKGLTITRWTWYKLERTLPTWFASCQSCQRVSMKKLALQCTTLKVGQNEAVCL